MERCDLEFLRAEIPKAFDRTFDGVERVTNIVKAMKEFAHPDANEQSPADLNHALETTLLVASNEYKYLAKIRTDFGDLPPVVCNVGELNQVFLNLIVNAAHAIQDAGKDVNSGEISISTAVAGDSAVIRIATMAAVCPRKISSKLYDPFFTTKEVGRGQRPGSRHRPCHRGRQARRRYQRAEQRGRRHRIHACGFPPRAARRELSP